MTIRILALAGTFVLGCAAGGGWLACGFTVGSGAMDPAVKEGQVVFVNRMGLAAWSPDRGDIVVFMIPKAEGQIVRRVLGLPGERIEVRDDEIYVDGEKIEEPWMKIHDRSAMHLGSPAPPNFGPVDVPAGTCFVLGDNRRASVDSRTFGPVPLERVTGRVWTLFGSYIL